MKHKIYLAFDVGLKRTGVAVGQSITRSTQAAGLIEFKHGRFNASLIDAAIIKWQPDIIVIGDPNSNDARLNKLINRIKHHIQDQHKLTLIEVNETLSSHAANSDMHAHGLSTKQKIVMRDQFAACLILESVFNSVL